MYIHADHTATDKQSNSSPMHTHNIMSYSAHRWTLVWFTNAHTSVLLGPQVIIHMVTDGWQMFTQPIQLRPHNSKQGWRGCWMATAKGRHLGSGAHLAPPPPLAPTQWKSFATNKVNIPKICTTVTVVRWYSLSGMYCTCKSVRWSHSGSCERGMVHRF